MSEPESKAGCPPIVVDTVEKAFQIFGDPNFTPKGMEWGSHPDHDKAVEGVTYDLTKDRDALRHWDSVGGPYHLGKEAWDFIEGQYRRKKPPLRSIDDDWMT